MWTVALRPHWLKFCHSFDRRSPSRKYINLLFMGIVVVVGIYYGTKLILSFTRENTPFIDVVPEKLLSTAFFVFFFFTVISNIASAYGYTFASRSNEIFLFSPLSSQKLYLTRLIETTISAGWMFLVFALPAGWAFYRELGLPILFVFTGLLASILMLFISGALGMIIMLLFFRWFPLRFIKLLAAFWIVFSGSLFLYLVIKVPIISHAGDGSQMLETLLQFEQVHPIWSPSRWVVDLLTPMLHGQNVTVIWPWLYLILLLIVLGAAGAKAFQIWFSVAYENAASVRSVSKKKILNDSYKLQRIIFMISGQRCGSFIVKEFKLLFRDMTQLLQMLMMLGLSSIYIYNLQALTQLRDFNSALGTWWATLLLIINAGLGIFITLAICSRFVFPSISFEGQGFWTIMRTPISIEEFLRCKFYSWLPVVFSICLLLYVVSGYLIGLDTAGTVLCLIFALIMTIGLTGLAIGTGSWFADFDWDSPAQVISSFGSIIFMILGLIVSGVSIILLGAAHFIWTFPVVEHLLGAQLATISTLLAVFLALIFNLLVARYSLEYGSNCLRRLIMD